MSNYHGFQAPNFSQHIAGRPLMPKKHPITNDYTISSRSLGVGVNGKVLECVNKRTGEKRALKVRLDAYSYVGIQIFTGPLVHTRVCRKKGLVGFI